MKLLMTLWFKSFQIRIIVAIAVMLKTCFTITLNQSIHSTPQNVISSIPHNHKNNSNLLDSKSFTVNSSLRVAQPRQFPVGTPSSLVSPFDMKTFSQQLLPLIHVNMKEKIKDFADTFHTGADIIEDAIRDGWRESPLNPQNFKHFLEPPKPFKRLPPQPAHTFKRPSNVLSSNHHRHHSNRHHPKAQQHKEKAQNHIESYGVDGLKHEYGVNGFKHFEDSILRELEKQEELKVEATIHTLFEQGDQVQIVNGKSNGLGNGWRPVPAPTKSYGDGNEIHSQIVSPLHTSIFNHHHTVSNDVSSGFHDFDNLNDNTIHSSYAVHEEQVESKVKPVKVRIPSVRKATVTPKTENLRLNSRYRKRHNHNGVINTKNIADSSKSGSYNIPKRYPNPNYHILSLTTSKPKFDNSTPKTSKISSTTKSVINLHNFDYAESKIQSKTTIKPSKNVKKEVSKYVDKVKSTGYRGSIKFGQSEMTEE
ncbi:CLUMA_CG007243, isoform A [Clunio marinus]|uniref:CLUMA_CG007243, isoform A n=1 Tax=Clunio marinus TaxID=568069 RepID=A0A1J1I0J2_9DIPT|nr:CLUMA_CG007243, isoform A [Clunio marinus]